MPRGSMDPEPSSSSSAVKGGKSSGKDAAKGVFGFARGAGGKSPGKDASKGVLCSPGAPIVKDGKRYN